MDTRSKGAFNGIMSEIKTNHGKLNLTRLKKVFNMVQPRKKNIPKTQVTPIKERRLPRSVHILGWTLIATALIIWGMPLVYEIYLSFTPPLDEHIEAQTRVIAEQSAVIFGIVVLILGILLSLRRWQWERKRARLQQIVREYRIRKAMEKRNQLR